MWPSFLHHLRKSHFMLSISKRILTGALNPIIPLHHHKKDCLYISEKIFTGVLNTSMPFYSTILELHDHLDILQWNNIDWGIKQHYTTPPSHNWPPPCKWKHLDSDESILTQVKAYWLGWKHLDLGENIMTLVKTSWHGWKHLDSGESILTRV